MELRVGIGDEWKNYKAFDKDTGEEIRYVYWGNDETGEISVCKLKDGKPWINGESFIPREIIKRNFEFRKVN